MLWKYCIVSTVNVAAGLPKKLQECRYQQHDRNTNRINKIPTE